MSITEPDTIDIVATRPDSSIVRLVITDHLDWSDFEGHARLIQDNVNTCLDFVGSGQMSRMTTPPVPENPEVHIVLVVRHAPSEEAGEFFTRVREFLEGVGVTFDVELRGVA